LNYLPTTKCNPMILDFEQFTRAATEVERIINLGGVFDLRRELENSGRDIEDPRTRREFYRHMNTLFLNILLNRLNSLPPYAEQRAIDARMNILEIMQTIQL